MNAAFTLGPLWRRLWMEYVTRWHFYNTTSHAKTFLQCNIPYTDIFTIRHVIYITICCMRQKGEVSITFVTRYKICDTVTFPERPSQRLVLSLQFSARHSLTLMLKIESLTHVSLVFSFPCMIVQRVCLLQKHDIDVHLHQIWASYSYISHVTMNDFRRDSFQGLRLIRYFLDAF